MKMTAAQAAAYEAMKAAEAAYKAARTGEPRAAAETRAAYEAANAAYNALLPQRRGWGSRDISPAARSGRRQHAEQAARTAAAMARVAARRGE